MSFVKMPQEDYVAMCDKLRAMLNEEQDYTSKDFIDKMDETILPNLDDTNFGNSSNLPTSGVTNPEYYEDIAKAINELKTANPIQIQELNATENKIYESENNIVWNKVSVDVQSGGGNPNYVETITGTLESPWGSVDPSELRAKSFVENSITVRLFADGTALFGKNILFVLLPPLDPSTDWNYFGAVASGPSSFYGATANYDGSGALSSAYIKSTSSSSYQNITEYAANIPTTLTIIHHLLPDTP